jgi:CubicO group peptidase (beta-lactamase class C family)
LVDWSTAPPADYGFDPFLLQFAVNKLEATGFIESLLIVRDGVLVSENYFRDNDATTELDISDITPGIISLLTGIALKEGIISTLNEKVVDYYPEYDSLITDDNKRMITLEHLLINSSGLPGDDTPPNTIYTVKQGLDSEEDWQRYILRLPLARQPGSSWAYSTLSSHLLAGIISKASDMSVRAFAEQHLFGPLDIEIDTWEADPSGYYCGGWGLHLTPRAMAKIGDLLHSDGVIDGERLFSTQYIEAALQPYFRTGWLDAKLKNIQFGYSWINAQILNLQVYLAQGYAGQLILCIPDLDLTLVITAQQAVDVSVAEEQVDIIFKLIAEDILPTVMGDNVPPPYQPDSLVSSIESNQSLLLDEEIHRLQWEPGARNAGENITAYKIYDYYIDRGEIIKRQIEEVPGNTTLFLIRHARSSPETIYGVAAVNNAGFVSPPQITFLESRTK